MTTPSPSSRPLPPEVEVAVALRSTPRAYAVLLGSGMSRSAGIATGWEVFLDLCQQVAHAQGEGEMGEEPLLKWFQESTGLEASYDNVLAALAQTSAERVGLLRPYFEPSPEEEEDGLKRPGVGHAALAGLVKAGLVRVILTTNFDRMVERALDEAGVPYVVSSTSDAIAGAMPLHLQECYVVKLHGDYRDPGMRNTPDELKEYAPATDAFLDQVLEEYGLIVIGWSAEYDVALRKAIQRARPRRFSQWWVDPGAPKEHAEALIAHRGAVLVQETGDRFLTGVADAVDNLDRLDVSSGRTLSLLVAAAKRALGPSGDRIRLHDLIKTEVASLAGNPHVSTTDFRGMGNPEYVEALTGIEVVARPLLSLVAVAAYWGDDQTDGWWLPAITSFGQRIGRTGGFGSVGLVDLTRYPGCLLLEVGAVAAVAGRRWGLLRKLTEAKVDLSQEEAGEPWFATYALDPIRLLNNQFFANGSKTGHEALDNPFHHVRDLVGPILTESLLLSELDAGHAADLAQYLLAASSFDVWFQQIPSSGEAGLTRFSSFRLARAGGLANATPEAARSVRALMRSDAEPLSAGLFGGDHARFESAADRLDEDFRAHWRDRRLH